jgi:hypothetical protein
MINISLIEKQPFLFTNHSAEITAPSANPLRFKASCLIEIISFSEL